MSTSGLNPIAALIKSSMETMNNRDTNFTTRVSKDTSNSKSLNAEWSLPGRTNGWWTTERITGIYDSGEASSGTAMGPVFIKNSRLTSDAVGMSDLDAGLRRCLQVKDEIKAKKEEERRRKEEEDLYE